MPDINWLRQGYVLILGVSMAPNGVYDGLGPGSCYGNEDFILRLNETHTHI
jgi:hypothetical protein